MPRQVVVGTGPVGSATARLLAERGDQVRLVTRSGKGPAHPNIERVSADATDPGKLTAITEGAVAHYNCAGPPYHRWSTDWPPLGDSFIRTAEATGAVLVHTGNLYGYGQPDGPMTEDLPLRPNSVKGQVRAKLWTDTLAAHHAGRIRAAEVRGSDYLGRNTLTQFSALVVPKILKGRRATVPADLDVPHSWTSVADVARTLVAVAADETAWGRPWHVPSAPALSMRDLANRTAQIAATPPVKLSKMPRPVLQLAGLVDPTAREMLEMQYQFQHPFVLDSTAATAAFGIEPTPIEQALAETIEGVRFQQSTK